LAVLRGHSSHVAGALALPDGCLLSWGEWDGTLRLWDEQSGVCLDVATETEAEKKHPDWLHARTNAIYREAVVFDFHLVPETRKGVLRHKTIPSILTIWHAGFDLTDIRLLLANGTAVLGQANHQVCILKLHHGQRRVTLAEAEEIIAPQIRLALEQARLTQTAKANRKQIESIKAINEHFLKGHWEFVSVECEKLLARGESLGEYGPKLITCLLNMHKNLSASNFTRIKVLLQDLENAGFKSVAAPLRQEFAEKKTSAPTKKPFWKFW
jgi:hypothetical protein